MYINKTKGIVIRNYDYGEGHRVVVIFTRRLGKIKGVAKGSRKTKSKFGASLEPFSENDFFLYKKPNQSLYIITGCDKINSNSGIREDMIKYGYGSLMLEGVNIMYRENDPEPILYDLIVEAFKNLKNENPASTAWLFVFRLLKYAGYRLDFFNCSGCSKKKIKEFYFSPESGGILCKNCKEDYTYSFPISAETVYAVRKISPSREITANTEREIGNAVEKFIKYHFNKSFKSLGFLDVFKKRKESCISRS
ncbi:MAG: DNA repair protein RecO [Elusimicrobiota bacterium]